MTENRHGARGGAARGPALLVAFGAMIALFCAVVIWQPDKFYADDSYFYFQVAWNFARGMGSTFNNIMPTNGYHPLWMLLCAGVFKILPAKTAAVHGIGALICALNAVALWVVAVVLRRVGSDMWPVAVVIYAPFAYMGQLGTEGALSGAMLALMVLAAGKLLAEGSLKAAAVFNLVVALAVLSRLDNIFVVVCVWVAVGLALDGRARQRLAVTAAIPVAMWGAYVGSNWIFFHTLQPISGLLKSSGGRVHPLGSNVPHTGMLALAIVVICMPVLAVWKRDTFFRTIELPLAVGVLCHAGYIVFLMSNETKWTWYYTSWMLLASIVAARVVSMAVSERPEVARVLSWCSLVLLAGLWVKGDYFGHIRVEFSGRSYDFQQAVYERLGMRRVLAFDEPGRMAFYSDVQVVALDGLTGDLAFQHALATEGIAQYAKEHDIDGFVGPKMPLEDEDAKRACGTKIMEVFRWTCEPDGKGNDVVTAVEVYARYPPKSAGTLTLRREDMVWNSPIYVAVWRLR